MSIIKLTLPGTTVPVDGKSVSFVAPCSCANADTLQIDDKNYDIVDALGESVTGSVGYWDAGAIVTVVLDTINLKAYLQNAARACPGKHIETTLSKSKWSNGVYSFNSQYNSTIYDITIMLNGDKITSEQKSAYDDADIVGLSSTNAIKALGEVPTVDIPVILKVVYK